MTPDEVVALARRAVVAPRWRWAPGMLRLRDAAGFSDDLRPEGRVPDSGDDYDYEAWRCIPDLTDPATLGAVLGVVRDSYGGFAWVARQLSGGRFRFGVVGLHVSSMERINGIDAHPGEAAALVAALEVPRG